MVDAYLRAAMDGGFTATLVPSQSKAILEELDRLRRELAAERKRAARRDAGICPDCGSDNIVRRVIDGVRDVWCPDCGAVVGESNLVAAPVPPPAPAAERERAALPAAPDRDVIAHVASQVYSDLSGTGGFDDGEACRRAWLKVVDTVLMLARGPAGSDATKGGEAC